MRKVEAVVLRERVEIVIDAVEEQTGHVGVTVVEAVGHGRQRGITHEYRGRVFESRFLPKALLTFVVADELAAAITLVPALCGLAGNRLKPRKVRKNGTATRVEKTPLTARWAAGVARRPLAAALAALMFMLLLAAPVLGMRTWPQDGSSAGQETSQRMAYDLIDAEFGAGANGPFTVVVETADADPAAVAATVADAARSGNDCGDGLVWTTAVDHVTHNRTGLPLRRAEEEAA